MKPNTTIGSLFNQLHLHNQDNELQAILPSGEEWIIDNRLGDMIKNFGVYKRVNIAIVEINKKDYTISKVREDKKISILELEVI